MTKITMTQSNRIYQNILLAFGCIFLCSTLWSCNGNIQSKTTNKEAKQWVKDGSWRDGLTIKPDSSINAVTFETQYKKHTDWWEKAMAFLNRKDLDTLKDGTYPIVGKKVFASISTYKPVNEEDKLWEAHHKYADIQAVITGQERIGKSPVGKLKVVESYNAEKDIEHLKGDGKTYVARPGTFFIFFPGDAHKPGLKVNKEDDQEIKKIVIKMRVD